MNINNNVNIVIINLDKHKNKVKEEIWAEIFDKKNDKILKKLIWWRDNNGVSHDESSNIPIKYRDLVDNAWISSI